MASSNDQSSLTLSCISAIRNRKRKAPDSNVYVSIKIPARHRHFHGPFRQQNWSLPETMVYYIAMNPSTSKLYQKMIKACKYFFKKKPIIVCSNLNFDGQKNQSQIEMKQGNQRNNILLKNISKQLWISDELCVNSNVFKIFSIVPNIYRCEAKRLRLHAQNISFNEYMLLASKAELICLTDVSIKDENGSTVSLESLIEVSGKIKKIVANFNNSGITCSSETVKNLLQIPRFLSLDAFVLNNIPESFDIEAFFTYVKKNKRTNFILDFSSSISDAYENRLESFVDEILIGDNYKPPLIYFDGIDLEKLNELHHIFKQSIRKRIK